MQRGHYAAQLVVQIVIRRVQVLYERRDRLYEQQGLIPQHNVALGALHRGRIARLLALFQALISRN